MKNSPKDFKAVEKQKDKAKKELARTAEAFNLDLKKLEITFDSIVKIEQANEKSSSKKGFRRISRRKIYRIRPNRRAGVSYCIRPTGGGLVSRKPYNLVVNTKDILDAVGLLFTAYGAATDKGIEAATGVIITLLVLCRDSKIVFNIEQTNALLQLYKLNAYKYGVNESSFIKNYEISQETINALYKMHCIDIIDGDIYLVEKIVIS